MGKYYLAARISNLDDFRQDNRIILKQAYLADADGKGLLNTTSIEELFGFIKENIKETSDILIYGDKALHTIFGYFKNNVHRNSMTERVNGTKINSFTWKRQLRIDGKKKKFRVKVINIEALYPTMNVDNLSTRGEIQHIINFIKTTPEDFDFKRMTSTLSQEAMKRWKETSSFGMDWNNWMKTEMLDDNGEIMYNDKGLPIMTPNFELWMNVYSAFNGGFQWTNPKYQMRHLKQKMYHYDVNSMYTHIMDTYKHPVGYPEYEPTEGYTYELYRVTIDEATTEGIPFIAVDIDWEVLGYIQGFHGDTPMMKQGKNRPRFISKKTVMMNNYTYKAFKERYTGKWSKEFVLCYQEEYDVFKEYNDAMKELKVKFDGNKEMRGYIKKAMVAPYGKNAQKPRMEETVIYFDDEIELDVNPWGAENYKGEAVHRMDNILYTKQEKELPKSLSFIPISQSISSKAEIFLLENVWGYEDTTAYIDTDAIISTVERPDLAQHQTEIGLWKTEAIYNELIIRGAKHYYGYTDNGHVIKGAGIQTHLFNPENMPLEEYAKNTVIFEYGRYIRDIVDGGIVEMYADIKLEHYIEDDNSLKPTEKTEEITQWLNKTK